MEPKYLLEWRKREPVLLQRLRGFWSPADFEEYRTALHSALSNRPAGSWLKISDVRGFKAQQATTDDERVANARFEFDSGLTTMVVIHDDDIAQMQRRRIHDASEDGHKFRYVKTDEEADALVGQLLAELPRR